MVSIGRSRTRERGPETPVPGLSSAAGCAGARAAAASEGTSVMALETARCRALVVLLDGWADLGLAAAQRAVLTTGATGGVIACLQEDRLVVVATEGVAAAVVGSDVSLVDTMLGHVIQSDDSLVLSTSEALDRFPVMRALPPAGIGWAAAPLRLSGQVVGALGLRFDVDDWPTDSPIAQLEYALAGRVAIEQAKGLLAGRHGLAMSEAFQAIRRYARQHQHRLRDIADDIIEGRLDPVTDPRVDHATEGERPDA